MTLFSSLMSAFRPSGRRANAFALGESIPWDTDAFPYHTVRRSIELAAMVPGRNRGRLEAAPLAMLERRSRRRRRRALLLHCSVGGLGLILLSLVEASLRHPSESQEARRAQRESIRPAPERPRRHVPVVARIIESRPPDELRCAGLR